jgi:hypothetical protein
LTAIARVDAMRIFRPMLSCKPGSRRELVYKDTLVDVFEPDIVATEQLIIELKHGPLGLDRQHFIQATKKSTFVPSRCEARTGRHKYSDVNSIITIRRLL